MGKILKFRHRPETPKERVESITGTLVASFEGLSEELAKNYAAQAVVLDFCRKWAPGAKDDKCRPRDLLNALALASKHHRYSHAQLDNG